MITVRKATIDDVNEIEIIYNRIHDQEESGLSSTGWIRNVYPTRETAIKAIERDDLFVLVDEDAVVASAVINKIQVPEYKDANWQYEAADEEVMVIHCLVVDPTKKGKGYGRRFVSFYEEYAKSVGCLELRMDTNALNSRARGLYTSLGYNEIGYVYCEFNGIPDVKLVCLEKHL